MADFLVGRRQVKALVSSAIDGLRRWQCDRLGEFALLHSADIAAVTV